MKTIIVDVNKNTITVEEFEDTLDNWYKRLDCDIIDITVRSIGGKRFDIICDDVGLLKPNKVSVLGSNYRPMLVGSIAITNDDGYGNLTSLSEEDIALIMDKRIKIVDIECGEHEEVRNAIISDDIAW